MGAHTDKDRPTVPRSIRHKRILERAIGQPDASFEELAKDIPSATADLVEHVLEEYGDPAETEGPTQGGDVDENVDAGSQTDDSSESLTEEPSSDESEQPSDGDQADADASYTGAENDADELVVEASVRDPAELSKKERETLQEIYDHPDLTQTELGKRLDVSNATVCNRVNAIAGFEWEEREAFAKRLFSNTEANQTTEEMNTNGTEGKQQVEKLRERVVALEERFEEDSVDADENLEFDDADLAHKIMHACLESDDISKDEELRIVKSLVT